MNRLHRPKGSRGIGRSLARTGFAGIVVASLGCFGIAGALAQENTDIYGGGTTVGSEDAGESVPMPVNINSVPTMELPGVANAVLGEEETPSSVELGALDVELPAPVDLGVVGEGMPSPVDISAIFESLGLPAPGEVAAPVTGPDISVDGTVGGDASGTITMGGGEAGTISIGDAGEGSVSGG